MSILALDYGQKRIGIAASDATRTLASPLPFISAQPFEKLLEQLKEIIQERNISLILIGIPRNMDGSLGKSAQAAQEFADRLKKGLPVKIKTVDERLSTVQASRLLHEAGLDTRKQKSKIDSAAAQVLLQQFLDSQSVF